MDNINSEYRTCKDKEIIKCYADDPKIQNRRILIIDDNENIHNDFKKVLGFLRETNEKFSEASVNFLSESNEKPANMEFFIDSAFQGDEGILLAKKARKKEQPYAVVFVDMHMPPGLDGLEVVCTLFKEDPYIQAVICTAFSDYTWNDIVDKVGITDRLLILKKPFDYIEVRQLASALVSKWHAAHKVDQQVNVLKTIIINRDNEISKRKRIEKKLNIAKKKAEDADRGKSEFLANMSHEFRTPMQGILTFSNFGISKFDSSPREKIIKYFREIHECGMRLLPLLNDILDLSKLETGKMVFQFEKLNIILLISNVLEELAALGSKDGISFSFDPLNPELMIEADRVRIMQVIRNLLSNAIKFSDSGSTVTVDVDDGGDSITISVNDSGIGIPEDELKSIFEKFIQSSKSKSGAGGTGLGLAISREIVLGHEGRIWAENNSSGGAAFKVILPKKKED